MLISFSKPRFGFVLLIIFLFIFLLSFFTANWKYETFRSNWARDLANQHQKFWSLAHGYKYFTLVSPQNLDGPEIWRIDHFSLIRLVFVPLYFLFPNIRTLFFGQSLIIYLGIFAIYALGVQFSKSKKIGLFCALSYALTPAVFNLSINDFRPLHLSIPLLLFTFYFYHRRHLGGFLLSGILTLAVREELLVALPLLGLLEVFKKESLFLKLRWLLYILMLSFGWYILIILYRMHFHGLTIKAYSDIFHFQNIFMHLNCHLSSFEFTLSDLISGLKAGFMYFLRYTSFVFLLAFLSPWSLIVVSPVVFYLCSIIKNEMIGMMPFSHTQHYTAIIIAFIFIAFISSVSKLWRFSNTNKSKANHLFHFKRSLLILGNPLLLFLILTMIIGFCFNYFNILRQPSFFNPSEQIKLNEFEKTIKKEDVVLTSNQLLAFFSSRKETYFYEEFNPFISWEEIVQKTDYAIVEKKHQKMYEELMGSGQFRVIDITENLFFFKKI